VVTCACQMKSDASIEELRKVVEFYEGLGKKHSTPAVRRGKIRASRDKAICVSKLQPVTQEAQGQMPLGNWERTR
jgi:hypothetical protein